MQSLEVSQKWKLRVFSDFSKHGSNPQCAWAPLDSLVYMGTFQRFYSPVYFFARLFLSRLFSQPTMCPVSYPLHQEVVSGVFPFKCLLTKTAQKAVPSLRKFRGGRNKGKFLSQCLREFPDMSNYTTTIPWEQSLYYPVWYPQATPGTWAAIPMGATILGSWGVVGG